MLKARLTVAARSLIVLAVCAAAPVARAADMKDAPRGRLPRTVLPLHYTQTLTIDPRVDSFDGESTIRVNITEPTTRIWMHGGDLDIHDATLTGPDGKGAMSKLAHANAGAGGVLALTSPKPIPAGEVELHFRWRGRFTTPLLGAYRMEWKGERYVITQMEALGARHTFPCFDEPSFKTPWDLTIVAPADDVTVANTRAISEDKLPGGKKRVRFATTEALPSYLIAFGVGPFDVVEAPPIPPTPQRATPLPLRGIAVRGRGVDLKYTLDNTPAIVKAEENYFGIGFPFDKLDLLAAPEFGYGAMENAGLITFRDNLILINDQSPTDLRQAFWGVVAHEVSHQWFGNLVTMPWWDDLWLNESFATWFASKMVMELRPEQHAERYQMRQALHAMETDELASTRRIHEPIDEFTDIEAAFDSISYAKGGAVLEMFEAYLGADKFRDAIRAHLHRFARGNATSADLMQSLGAATDQPEAMVRAFRSFTDQPGVPLVDLEMRCDQGAGQLSVHQRRSLPLGSTAKADAMWAIPVCMRVGSADWEERACVLVDKPALTPAITLDQCPGWVMPNADGAGYYRFSLDSNERHQLEAQFAKLNAREQLAYAGSLDAAFYAGTLSPGDYLAALPRLAGGASWEVVSAPFTTAEWIRDHLAKDHDQRAAIELYLRRVYTPLLAKLGLADQPGEDDDRQLTRQRLVNFVAHVAEDPEVRQKLVLRAKEIVGDGSDAAWKPDAIGSNLRATALWVYGQEGGPAAQALLTKRLAATQDTVLRGELLEALGAVRDPQRTEQVRALALDPHVKASEVGQLLESQVAWPENRTDARRWIGQHRDVLLARLPAMFQTWAAWIDREGACSEAEAKEEQALFEKRLKNVEGGPRAMAQLLEATRLCATLQERQSDAGFGTVLSSETF